jgi:hypothetical protein
MGGEEATSANSPSCPSSHSVLSLSPADSAQVQYTIDVEVGRMMRVLIVDTGSLNSWVSALLPFSGTNCKGPVKITYGSAYGSSKEVCS